MDKVINLRKFFEVAKLSVVDTLAMPGIAFRVKGGNEDNNYALAAWSQRARVKSRKIEVKPINISKLKEELPNFRKFTSQKPDFFQEELRKSLAKCGIALVFVSHIDGSFLHGASFYDGKRIVLGLSVRGKTSDIFWFSLFHELYHIIDGYINTYGSTTETQEIEADNFARDTLIPIEKYESFVDKGIYTRESICEFANELGVGPGIVLGRLQRDNIVKYSSYQDLKDKYEIV